MSLVSIPSHSSKLILEIPKTSVLTVQPPPSDAFGSFTITSSASAFLRTLAAAHARSMAHVHHQKSYGAPIIWADDFSPSSSPSVPTTPISTHFIPSISHTSLSFYNSDTANTSLTALSDSQLSGNDERVAGFNKINPILASLERKSKLCYQTICATCSKPGIDFPKCGRCGDMWCSRACRLKGGKRHVC